MLLDVEGRVRNIDLSHSSPLLPLLEAVVNSFDALDDFRAQSHPKITSSIQRDRKQLALKEEAESYPIAGFVVEDNGPGFNDANYESFCTSDSTLKIARGGKGVGRLLWLKAFRSVSIDSSFEQNGVFLKRNFNFSLSREGVDGGDKPEATSETTLSTKVHLIGLKEELQKKCPKKLDTIAHKIIQHFIALFMSPQYPSVYLIDEDSNGINLNDLFRKEYKAQSSDTCFKVKGESFNVSSVKIKTGDHRLSFCANNREVFGEDLKDSISDLAGKLNAADGTPFAYQAFISGSLLDSKVNAERTYFHIPPKPVPLGSPEEVTIADIKQNALNNIKSELEPFLYPIRTQKAERVQNYVRTQAPQYRPLLKHANNQIAAIPPGITDELLDNELYKINHTVNLEIRQETKQYLTPQSIRDIRQDPEYKEKYDKFIQKLNDMGKATIAEYIVHRKVVLELFANALKQRESEAYALEESVHGIVFPMHTTSDNIEYAQHNLWIIDEKLAYHYLLASDKKLNQVESINTESTKRPDILIFNNPFAFADQAGGISSIVIIEFKRPMRNDYDAVNDNPITQVYNYVRELRSGKKHDKNGRPVSIDKTPAYAFIVCDLMPKMKELAVDAGLVPTPDGEGFFGFNSPLLIYIEVLSYGKILADSQKRNRVLFDRLNIT